MGQQSESAPTRWRLRQVGVQPETPEPSVLMRLAPWLLPQVRSSDACLSCSPLAMLPCLSEGVLEALSPLLEAWRTAKCSRSRV